MAEVPLFWTLFAAILCANLLSIMFVWACLNISRREARQESLGLYLGCAVTPIAFGGLAFYIAMGGT